MRALVKNCETHHFLKDAEEWTLNPAKARIFPSSLAAMDFCLHHNIKDVDVILKAQEERYDVYIVLRQECWGSSNRIF